MNLREHAIVKEYVDANVAWGVASTILILESRRLAVPPDRLPSASENVKQALYRYELAEKAFMELIEGDS